MQVDEIPVEATYGLRRTVLRDGRPDAVVAFPEDAHPAAFHLAARAGTGETHDGVILAVASFSPEPTPYRPGRTAVHLRGMAVDHGAQRRGVGRMLVATAVERLRAARVEVLWCNARDTAAGFYSRLGFETHGDGFVLPESGIPHHVMLLDL